MRAGVLRACQLGKDLGTGTQSTNPPEVLDGAIDPFIESALAQRIEGGSQVEVEDLE